MSNQGKYTKEEDLVILSKVKETQVMRKRINRACIASSSNYAQSKNH